MTYVGTLEQAKARVVACEDELSRFRTEHKIMFDGVGFRILGASFAQIPRLYQRQAELVAALDEASRRFQLALNRRQYER